MSAAKCRAADGREIDGAGAVHAHDGALPPVAPDQPFADRAAVTLHRPGHTGEPQRQVLQPQARLEEGKGQLRMGKVDHAAEFERIGVG
jgi:hypothetical protein